MSFYFEKSIGIDIREDSVSLVLLGIRMRRIDVLGAEFLHIPSFSPSDEKMSRAFLDGVNRFLMKHNAWPRNAVFGLPRPHFTFQTFDLPAPDLKSVRSMVGFELERHFTVGLDSLYYTFQASPAGENLYHIAATAIHRQIANPYLELGHKLSLRPSIVDVSTFANVNLVLGDSEKEGVAAIIDLSSSSVEITIIKNGVIQFSRNVAINDPDIRNAYFQSNRPEKHYELLSEGLGGLIVEEIQNTLASCRNLTDAEAIGRIHLVGGGPFAPSLARKVREITDVETVRVGLPGSVNPDLPDEYSAVYMSTALSLAKRELEPEGMSTNLLPAELRPKKKKSNPRTTLALAAGLALFLIGVAVNQIVYNNRVIASLDLQLREVKGLMAPIETIDLEYQNLAQFIHTLNRVEAGHPSRLTLLQEMSRILPKDTWLNGIKIHDTEVEIKGYSAAASKLIPLLEQSPLFKDAGFVGSLITEAAGEKFTLRTTVEAAP